MCAQTPLKSSLSAATTVASEQVTDAFLIINILLNLPD